MSGVLSGPQVGKRLHTVTAGALLDELRANGRIIAPLSRLTVVERDPDDNRVIETAVAGRADYIVSGDRDLLDLGEHEGIPIVTPAQFLAILAAG